MDGVALVGLLIYGIYLSLKYSKRWSRRSTTRPVDRCLNPDDVLEHGRLIAAGLHLPLVVVERMAGLEPGSVGRTERT